MCINVLGDTIAILLYYFIRVIFVPSLFLLDSFCYFCS
nr:MAG TPA: hypothetical protein [Caudoviricetes sp.]